jgi:hypothetical protein
MGTVYGSPEMTEVIAIGYLAGRSWCASCSHEHALVDIAIRDGRIEHVAFRSFEPWTRDVLFDARDGTPVRVHR